MACTTYLVGALEFFPVSLVLALVTFMLCLETDVVTVVAPLGVVNVDEFCGNPFYDREPHPTCISCK